MASHGYHLTDLPAAHSTITAVTLEHVTTIVVKLLTVTSLDVTRSNGTDRDRCNQYSISTQSAT